MKEYLSVLMFRDIYFWFSSHFMKLKNRIMRRNIYHGFLTKGSAGQGMLYNAQLNLLRSLIDSGENDKASGILKGLSETDKDEFYKCIYWLNISHPKYEYPDENLLIEN